MAKGSRQKGEGDPHQEAQLIAVLLQAQQSGLNRGTSGNASLRGSDDSFVITPSALPYDEMTAQDLVLVMDDHSFHGRHRPSSEWLFHAAIYRARPDVGAIVHLHSPAATALAALRLDIPAFHYMVAVAGGNSIRCGDYATFGTDELAKIAVTALNDRTACLLANHGQIACGATVAAAYNLAVEVESLAQQYLMARSVGSPALLSAAQMTEVLDRFADYRSTAETGRLQGGNPPYPDSDA